MNKTALDSLQEWRRQKLIALIGWPERGAIIEFARKHGLNPSRLSHLLLGVRPMGEKAARNLEERIGRRPGWFDEGYLGPEQEETLDLMNKTANIMQQEMLRLMATMSLEEQSELLRHARLVSKARPRLDRLLRKAGEK
jgi:hypothetical protein